MNRLKISVLCVGVFLLTACGNNAEQAGTNSLTETETVKETETVRETEATKGTYSLSTNSTEATVTSESKNRELQKKQVTAFTNAYGTSTTKCAHSGCNNYIASSGDTSYCKEHSNRCLNCNAYIDEDALYCVSCIKKAATKIESQKHTCEVCSKEGKYTLTGLSGATEYYCAEHYNELYDMINSMFGN